MVDGRPTSSPVERVYEYEWMELSRVVLHNWPPDSGEPGGWVMPHDNQLLHWVVAQVHAQYVAPRIPFGTVDGHGRPVKPRGEYHAYLVDLAGEDWGLPDYQMVLLHQVPPSKWWMIKPADEETLERIEKYRV